jgi:hypothetical protein
MPPNSSAAASAASPGPSNCAAVWTESITLLNQPN